MPYAATKNGNAAIILSGLILLFGCSNTKEEIPEGVLLAASGAPPPEEKPTYTVQRGAVTDRIQFLGNVSPIDERNVFFRMDGRVRVVNVEETDFVRRGDTLAELEMTDLLNQINQATVNLERAQLRLAELEANTLAIAEAQAEQKIKRLKLEQAQSQDPTASVDIAQANLEKSAILVEQGRINDLLAGHEEPSFQLRQAQLNQKIAEANSHQAMQNLEAYRYRLEIMKEEAELATLKLKRLQEHTDPQALTDVKLAELTLKRLEDQAAMHRIVSPMNGQIMSLSLYAGNVSKAYRPVIIVADPSRFEISAYIVSSMVMKLHSGQKVIIELVDHPGQTISGWIRRLPYIGQRNTDSLENADQSTRIQFDPPENVNLKVGDLARATIVLEQRQDVLYLPPEGIRIYQGRRFVVIQDGDSRRRVDVKVGLKSEDRVEIEEGVEEGDIILGQ